MRAGTGFAARGRWGVAKVGDEEVPLEYLEIHKLAQYVEKRVEAFTNCFNTIDTASGGRIFETDCERHKTMEYRRFNLNVKNVAMQRLARWMSLAHSTWTSILMGCSARISGIGTRERDFPELALGHDLGVPRVVLDLMRHMQRNGDHARVWWSEPVRASEAY